MVQIGCAAALIVLSTIIAVTWMVRTCATDEEGKSTRTPYAVVVILTTMVCLFGGLAALVLGIKEQMQEGQRRMLQIGSAAALLILSTSMAVAWMVRTPAKKEGESRRTPYAIAVVFAVMLCFLGGLAALITGITGDFSEYHICGGQVPEKDIFV